MKKEVMQRGEVEMNVRNRKRRKEKKVKKRWLNVI
jgi:hypothetical protein